MGWGVGEELGKPLLCAGMRRIQLERFPCLRLLGAGIRLVGPLFFVVLLDRENISSLFLSSFPLSRQEVLLNQTVMKICSPSL